ncbi:MAG: RNA polymerase sigma-54 factor [Ignavibacteria bacterium RIFCSPLOWO2_02_FULL_55_14]|nr:MAG: RNA polymerase sigma-54 factor [Ignavibacteria bacterium GWC2_56_12]OGU63398.1 MAG: RNA polymerase sigma-54 factor [Ignavibacteria bacterium RIFCSPHIGHO2_02_FULL_56_12]OGU70461.1 MAG: RNA polymerase sigma-54 factor [Ignavibacteria bacterium RIFCSPLOWO2_12_FULL_56_21]OGU73912.1 MAG: RNA polymerase sigma-54 factor [Ignavibacteria bacterium RIFCSPLOWO2_02_FULL_55_14]HAV22815.1 RNA polymerase sigma-54 factor [Bacteroidota bacterium]
MLSLHQQLKLGLKLTPQQVQYLKLLQLPSLSLEQRVKLELEQNPMLEVAEDLEPVQEEVEAGKEESDGETDKDVEKQEERKEDEGYTLEDYISDDNAGHKSPESLPQNGEEEYESPLPASVPLTERLLTQFRMLDVEAEEELIAEEILGNVDEDGYLRRDLALIVQDLNLTYNLTLSVERAEAVLHKILNLDPPGVAARTLPECLAAQLRCTNAPPALRELAYRVVTQHFDDFRQKRFDILLKHLHVPQETLKRASDLIQRMNPKPGEGEFSAQENYVTPDFIVNRDHGEFIITLNDRNIPPLRINNAYKALIAPKGKKVAQDAKDFVRKKFEAAKWFIASIHQRRETLLRVMRAILERQHQWFADGEVLRPMIYKDIAEVVGVDISTISRVVNSKYVQTEFGVYPLRFFFTSGLTSESGEEVSNTAVKQRIKDLISAEDPKQPLNDDTIGKILNQEGIHIARRTVAKYRESLGIPIARLRVKI